MLLAFSQHPDGGFGLRPDQEAHGGSTYCAVASLCLMGRLDALGADQMDNLIRWCMLKKVSGCSGRGVPAMAWWGERGPWCGQGCASTSMTGCRGQSCMVAADAS